MVPSTANRARVEFLKASNVVEDLLKKQEGRASIRLNPSKEFNELIRKAYLIAVEELG